jgi:hypothetical protein
MGFNRDPLKEELKIEEWLIPLVARRNLARMMKKWTKA